jgi:hypothetical protein
MDEGVKPIVPIVVLVIVGGILFLAATGIGDMIVSGIQQVVGNLFQEAGITSVVPNKPS